MASGTITHDLFLSYSSPDREVVEAVAEALRQRGVDSFLDRRCLDPGQPWPDALERAVRTCRAVAIFLGPGGMGSWQQQEKWLALDRQARDGAVPVIPVLLPGADPGLEFLSLMTWVDLRRDIRDSASIEALAAAAMGEDRPVTVDRHAAARGANICPYRGLNYFREEDAPFFCGREQFADRLTETVSQRSLVAVVGASGTGKSSVVRAGLLPKLRGGEEGRVWEIASIVPGDRPLHAIAAALLPFLEPDMTEVDRLTEINKLADRFVGGAVSIGDVVSRLLGKQPGTERLLLVVDQWEELYTLVENEAWSASFTDEILDAVDSTAITVVLTLRADFFGHVLEHRRLSDKLQGSLVHLRPMSRKELGRAIVEPAHKSGLEFESGLAETILDDVGDEPGNLPLVEFVLTELWEARRQNKLTHDAYGQIGRVKGAMAARADAQCDALGKDSEAAIRALFLQLVQPGETADTRRRIKLSELGVAARSVVAPLVAARLVVTSRDDATGEQTVEVAHEALIRHWRRLRDWISVEREFLRWRATCEVLAKQWREDERRADRLLSSGRSVSDGERMLRENKDALAKELAEFVEASVIEEERRKSRKLRNQVLTATAFLAVLAAVVLGSVILERGGVSWSVPYVWTRVKLGLPPLPKGPGQIYIAVLLRL